MLWCSLKTGFRLIFILATFLDFCSNHCSLSSSWSSSAIPLAVLQELDSILRTERSSLMDRAGGPVGIVRLANPNELSCRRSLRFIPRPISLQPILVQQMNQAAFFLRKALTFLHNLIKIITAVFLELKHSTLTWIECRCHYHVLSVGCHPVLKIHSELGTLLKRARR